MLAPTRLRLLNVGMERPRFADLIIDMRSNGQPEDTVIMLQNGGGKSTLIAMWLHAYEPHRDKFLAKMSGRHQKKEGIPKKFEHYIPVGSTTYVVAEHAIGGAAENLFGVAPRLIVGYAAWRDSEAQDRASELFFCFQTTDTLTFDTLPVRDAEGNPVSHTEFLDHMLRAKLSDPTLQLTHTDDQSKWAAELANRGFDLDFLRRFLLQMNLDEGAADRLFTYQSSRAFLNSLINVLAEPRDFEAVAREVQRLTGKVASREANLATQEFLVTARKYTEPLAAAADHFRQQRTARTEALLQWAQTRRFVEQWVATADAAKAHVTAVHSAATSARGHAQSRVQHLTGQRAALHTRRCELDLEQAKSGAGKAADAVAESGRDLLAAKACVLIAERAVAAQDQQFALKQQQDKVREAAPLRRDLAITADVLADRLTGEIDVAAGLDAKAAREQEAGDKRLDDLNAAATQCAQQLAAADKDVESVEEQRAAGRALRERLRKSELVDPDESADRALARHRSIAASCRQNVTHRLKQAADADAASRAAHAQARGLQPELDTTAKQITTAENTLAQWERQTNRLTAEITNSGLVDLDTIDLDEHADIILSEVRSRTDGTRARARSRAVRVSQVERDLQALEVNELLPARPEVEELVKRVQQDTSCGVVPGWTWLSRLPGDRAIELLRHRPELADGVIVPIDDDYQAVVAWLTENAPSIAVSAPVVVAVGAPFFQADDHYPRYVVLPDHALWDPHTGREALPRMRQQLESVLADRDDAENVIALADHIARKLDQWLTDIGQGGAERKSVHLAELTASHRELVQRHEELLEQAATCQSEAAAHRVAAEEQRDFAEQAEEAVRQVLPLVDHDADEGRRSEIESDAKRRRDDALGRQNDYKTERGNIRVRAAELERRRRDLAVSISDLRRHQREVNDIRSAHPSEAHTPDDRNLLDMPRDALDRRLRDLNNQYHGLVTDEDLRSRIKAAEVRVTQCSNDLAALGHEAERQAQILFDATPQLAISDWRSAQSQAEERNTVAVGEEGAARQRRSAAAAAVDAALKAAGGRSTLDPSWHAADLETAQHHVDAVAELLHAANIDVTDARSAVEQAVAAENRLTRFVSAVKDRLAGSLTAAAKSLAAAGKLGQAISLDDLQWETTDTSLDQSHPVAARLIWMNEALRDVALAADPLTLAPGLERFSADDLEHFVGSAIDALERVTRQYRAAEDHVHSLVERLRSVSLNASPKAAGTIVSRLRAASMDELIANATSNDSDAYQRLAAVSADLQGFTTELDHSVRVVSTTVETIRGRIRTIANRSKLPTDERLGVWSGQEFLKIHWSESSRDNRQKFIRDALEAMINNGERQMAATARQRPASGSAPLEVLVEAITPNLRAEILIPKVPFDGKHYAMEELARRTSGGEGVTMAVIIAALMLSMRSPSHKEQTFLIIDNIFAKVSEPGLLRLIRHIARGLRVQLILLTPSRDPHALSVFSNWVQLKLQVAGRQVLVAPESVPGTDIPRQLRREPLVAVGAAAIQNTTAARIMITDPSLGTIAPPDDVPGFSDTADAR